MSKEYIEAFRDILGILSAVSGCEVDMNSERIITVKSALQRLESIDNANPSEALECLEKIIDNLDDYADFEIKQEANEYIDTIKQALLKAQEPKHYLKWEDLEFKEEEQCLKVKMGDNFYRIDWCNDDFGANVVSFYKYITKDYLVYCSCIKHNGKQLFNDLHLERVE